MSLRSAISAGSLNLAQNIAAHDVSTPPGAGCLIALSHRPIDQHVCIDPIVGHLDRFRDVSGKWRDASEATTR